jgi:O-antigen/teichoic acid export membrane protein
VTVLLIFGSLTDAGIHFPVISRFLSLLISSLISFTILMRLLNIKIPQNNLYQKDNKESTPNISSVLSSSNPFMLTQLLFVINNGIGIMILTSISSLSNVGIYSVAFKVSSYLMLIVNAVNSFVMPIFSKLWKENDISSIRKIYFKSTIFIFSLTSLLALFVIFFSEDILFYFGEDFIQSKNCLIILILTQVIVSYFGPLDSLLSMTDNQKIVRNNLFLSVAINSVLCFSLIPIFGIIGAAFAVFISRLFFVLLQIFYIYSKIGFFPRLRLFHD